MREGPDPRELWYKIKANADPLKLLDQISTNHKDIVLKERSGNVELAQPERKEPGELTSLHKGERSRD
ncbi:hypothetical protein H4Q26_016566 [Puccinia striiformis f. sp. tritici PST-130]|uniref:Uncharacterized protein n=1 Tax=Puccinia striiformis f. sp. tritici PST-78 TaxID=1165861 RepID=A0A0L0VMU1_9BASI|nr:hypothetical protein H4Q26_016566 [Puccinia striiformis f. sp. tritici PST-130]KNF00345.1 hypothetical protein PSTG_06518 [Puccinia striiformis f. sp. tritici PST-78]